MSGSNGVKEMADRLGISLSDSPDPVDLTVSTGTYLGSGSAGSATMWSPFDYSNGVNNISISPSISPSIYTTNGTGWPHNPLTVSQNATLTLQGEDADIMINGVSLNDTLKNIEQRLGILRPNTELEAEWDQLQALGNQYRKLEKQLREKSDMWAKLKAMPPPEID